jgi:hypothetical protein
MPKGLKRFYGAGDLHYIACSCYKRKRWLGTGRRRDLFFEDSRRSAETTPVRGSGLRGHAGAFSSADERTAGGKSFDGDAEREAALCAEGDTTATT